MSADVVTAAAPIGGAVVSAGAGGAARSTFFWPMRLLPSSRRQAAFAVYAFCRAVDDIADGDDAAAGASVEKRAAALAEWRQRIEALYCGNIGEEPALKALAAAIERYRLPRDAFMAIIDGMAMDVAGPVIAPDMATLQLYCARVAGAVGRLLVRIFVPTAMFSDQEDAFALALGEALQLTNILRDVEEDAGMGRLYLPDEALRAAGMAAADPVAVLADPRLAVAWNWLAGRAEARFTEATRMLAVLPARGLWPAVAMMVLYRRLFDRLLARGWRVGQPRLRLGRWECARVTVIALLGHRPSAYRS